MSMERNIQTTAANVYKRNSIVQNLNSIIQIIIQTAEYKHFTKRSIIHRKNAIQLTVPSLSFHDLLRSIAHSTYFYYFRPSK